jgi:hypothetical protein
MPILGIEKEKRMLHSIAKVIAENERELDAEVSSADKIKDSISLRHDLRIRAKIADKGFAKAYEEMMNSSKIGWLEAQAWKRATVNEIREGRI